MAGIWELLTGEPAQRTGLLSLLDTPDDYDPKAPATPSANVPVAPLGELATRREITDRFANHSMGERFNDIVRLAAGAIGYDPTAANRMAGHAETLLDFVPLVGDAKGVDDVRAAVEGGRYGEAAINAVAAGAGLVPMVGDLAGKTGREILSDATAKVADEVISELPMDEASRMARAKAMGYSDDVFWRGEATGKLPDEYPGGGFFSRDRETSAGSRRRVAGPARIQARPLEGILAWEADNGGAVRPACRERYEA